MKWKRIIPFCLAAGLCVGAGIRIWAVNYNRPEVETVIYPMGEVVDLGDDYFYNPNDKCSDYDIKVLSAEVLPVDEYLEKYGLIREEVWGEDEVLATTVYEVTVWLRNNNTDMENDTQNIDLVNMQLTTNRDIYQVDHELLWALYPQLDQSTYAFRVAPGTETTVHLPYRDLKSMRLSIEEIKNRDTYLYLSMYPTKRMVEIHPDN